MFCALQGQDIRFRNCTCPPSRYQAYRPGSFIFARGPLGPRANMECRADMPGIATVDMF